jgi:hypothetical protein
MSEPRRGSGSSTGSAKPSNWWNAIPSTVSRVVIGLLLGGIAFVLTSIGGSHQSLEQQLNFSLLITGLAVIVQFLGDVEKKLALVEDRSHEYMVHIEKSLSEKFEDLNSATALFSAIEQSAIDADIVTRLVRNATRIDQEKPTLIKAFAQMEIARYAQFFEELSSGMVTYEGEDRDWLLTLTKAAQRTIFATSLTTVDAGGRTFDGGFWQSDLGQRYLEAQGDAIKRGVKITRLFVLERTSLRNDPSFKKIVDAQKEIGIELRVLGPEERKQATRTLVFDFILFDECVSYEMTPGSMNDSSALPMILETTIESHKTKLEERIRRFNELWELAVVP